MVQPHIKRIVTASSLFDGHDAAINVFRRMFQKSGLEVIHIGHNRSVLQLVKTAIQEDVDAVCVSSYQGGHMEYFRYLRDLLNENGGSDIAIFAGGGGTILPSEIQKLEAYGITRVYHPQDGQQMGLHGIIRDAISKMTKTFESEEYYAALADKIARGEKLSERELAKAITFTEQNSLYPHLRERILRPKNTITQPPAVIGVTGPGGAGKSCLVDELILRYLYATDRGRVGILACDPTKKMTGGGLLGDRIRMNTIYRDEIFLRSMATRSSDRELSTSVEATLELMKRADFDLIILETTGIGQGDAHIVGLTDICIYVMTAEYGASSQLEKIDMIDFADLIAINKFEKIGSADALDDVLHTYAYSRNIPFNSESRHTLPVYGTSASDFNNPGVTRLFGALIKQLDKKGRLLTLANQAIDLAKAKEHDNPLTFTVIPAEKTFYLGDIASCIYNYQKRTHELSEGASLLYRIKTTYALFNGNVPQEIEQKIKELETALGTEILCELEAFHRRKKIYKEEEYVYKVRDKTIKRPLFYKSLSNSFIPKIATPSYRDWGDIVTFIRKENFPGEFPYTCGVFPLKSEEEEPKRQFAGEGSPERTNKRFHYLSQNDPYIRLSTAFDSVTLYGEDPANRPDIYGKIGNSGVSIATLDDMKALFDRFDLIDPHTSVSLTINGPSPMILAMFFNAAIDFEVRKQTGKERDDIPQDTYEKIRDHVLSKIRGTVQADILKEEQAQNTCIFSSKFALKMMGDIEEYFIKKSIRNFYSVSISGYHIAEAGANPITQLAFTLANGFTIVEYYLSRGMAIDDFAPNLSFFFSSGLDPEYSVIGRVARRIWSIAMKERYGANERSCKLKYHIQTSGRSLHAQEIAFNDIRTTLQALLAIYDNCNSLHTNAYDEAITTPTEESVRRAMAIQLILSKEFGMTKCQNSLQGSYYIEELTDLVEKAVLAEFESLSRRGGVLGAMEKQYQRHRIQTESMKYETQKESGELPIIGINTFIAESSRPDYEHMEVIRATEEEKQLQISRTKDFIARAADRNRIALENLKEAALGGKNIFEALMETVKYCSLGQISQLLYACGGEYRRSM